MRGQHDLTCTTGRGHPDALELLERDHMVVTDLLDAYEDLENAGDKEALVSRVIVELTIHGRVEEELFLPTLRDATGDAEVVDDASVGHAMIRTLMADLHGASATDPHYDETVKALAELVKHHIAEEERQMFVDAFESGLDLYAVGKQLAAYQSVLRSRYEIDSTGEDLAAFLTITTRSRDNSVRRLANSTSKERYVRSRPDERRASGPAHRAARRSIRVVAGHRYPRRSAQQSKES